MIIGRRYIDYKSLLPKIVAGAVVLVLAIFPAIDHSVVTLSILISSGIWGIAAMGFTLILRTGQFSMGQAAFMAIGGYVAAILTVKLGVPFWPSFLASGVLAGVVAFLIGIVVLRVGGTYFSIITLAFGEMVRIVITNWESVTRGAAGILLRPPAPIAIGNFEINFATSIVPYYYFMFLLVAISGLVFWQIDRSRIGGTFRGVAANPMLSEHLGVPLMKYRVIAFTVAGVFTGLAGAFHVHFISVVTPLVYGLWQSIQIMMMSIVGGISSIVGGSLIGAFALYTVSNYLTRVPIFNIQYLVFGAVVVLVVLFLPRGTGIIDLWSRFWRKVFKDSDIYEEFSTD